MVDINRRLFCIKKGQGIDARFHFRVRQGSNTSFYRAIFQLVKIVVFFKFAVLIWYLYDADASLLYNSCHLSGKMELKSDMQSVDGALEGYHKVIPIGRSTISGNQLPDRTASIS